MKSLATVTVHCPRSRLAALVLAVSATAATAQGLGPAARMPQSAPQVVSPQAVGCKLIRNVAQLQAIRNDLAGSYCLANDIDAGSIANFVPIGDANNLFTGKLFGNGRVIRNLTIRSEAQSVGLFGVVYQALIQDVGLVNVDIAGTLGFGSVGGLVSYVDGGPSEIRRVHVSGRIATAGDSSYAGGIVGRSRGFTLADSWSSARVSGGANAGGAIGYAEDGAITRVHATGPITCAAVCNAGGLIGYGRELNVVLSYASGPVIAGDSSSAGGLFGTAINSTIGRSHALGAVSTGASEAGGLIAYLEGGSVAEAYAIGRVTGEAGSTLGGLVAVTAGTPTVTNAYWDVNTSNQTASAAGTGYTRTQMRAALPPGFGNAWAITKDKSYPFLDDADIAFAAPLATLIKTNKVFTFLPIAQRDDWQYLTAPANADAASLAAVYAMIARAIGIARDVPGLKNAKIDKYFWDDATQTTTWKGPVTTQATLGAFAAIAPAATLNGANVTGEMKNGKLVALRGTYTKGNGDSARHWLLGTLYTSAGGDVGAVVANDPWTGRQAMIDPRTKKVVSPPNFPLASFKIDGYRPITVN